MSDRFDDEAAVATDAYIDLLLNPRPIVATTPAHAQPLSAGVRNTIDALHSGLPRFHPSFAFEDRLADRLRAAGEGKAGEIVRVGFLRNRARAARAATAVDRRMLLGGAAIAASGVSMAAVYAWRHSVRVATRRPRHTRLAREVPI